MRGPEHLEKRRAAKQAGAKGRGHGKGKGAAQRRVPGGKALARQLYFLEQRRPDGALEASGPPAASSRRALIPSRRARATATKRGTGLPSLFAAYEEKVALDSATAAMVPQAWRPLGPFSIPHGQTYGSGPKSRPSVSGRVAAIAVDPGNGQHLLVGSAGGGVWESKDAGKTWAPRTDDQPSLAIGAVAFDPRNPSIAYAGTGEGDSTFVDAPNPLGAGLLRSTDGGTTWAVHATAPFEQTGFYDIAIDPLNNNHLLAATSAGLFESINGGTSWTQRRTQRTWSVSIHPPVAGDPNSTKEIFASSVDGIFRSTNGGSTWSKVTLPGAPSSFDRVEVCYAPSDANIVYIFAAGDPQIPDPMDPNSPMPTPYLWRRSVVGGAFSRFTSPNDLQTGQAWYDWFAAVAPNNPDVLYLGGINAHKGVRSAPGTWDWKNISAKTGGDSTHPDQHEIAFGSTDPNIVYLGNDGGIYRSPDGGLTWESLNKGLCITEVEFLAQHPQFEAWLIAGLQDNGTMRYQGQEVWFHVGDGDGGDCGVNQASPYTCYHTFYAMGIARSTQGGGWDTWTPKPDFVIGPPVSTADDYPNGALFYPPVEVNGQLVAQAGRAVFISGDTGDTWKRVALPTGVGLASALAIPTTTTIYVGTARGHVFRIDFSTGKWQPPVRLAQPANGYISDMLLDPTDANRLYVTYQASAGGRVFRSDDGGAHWNNISAGLPNVGINAIEIDPANTNNLFVAADLGVYRSNDAGASWTAFSKGLPNALVKDLVFHQPSRLLRAGTQARGVWEIAVDQGTIPDVEVYLRDSSVDTGRLLPSPSNVDDPFTFGSKAFWFQCPDIKVDSPSFQRPSAADVDFEVFGDDESMVDQGLQFAAGLEHENPQRNRTVRLFVQVHNRGVKPATNVAVKVFYATASLPLPDLPAGFWTGFPNNTVTAGSPWQSVAAHRTVPRLDAGKAQIVNFEWPVAATVASNVALLAIISADDDSIATTELNVAALVQNSKKCGLKNVTVVNPTPAVSPAVRALPIDVRKTGNWKTFSLEADDRASNIVRSVVLSKRLSKVAQKAKMKRVKLTAGDKEELNRLIATSPSLKRQLDLKTAYAIRPGIWLGDVSIKEKQVETLLALINPQPGRGHGSIVQKAEDGTIIGGVTVKAL